MKKFIKLRLTPYSMLSNLISKKYLLVILFLINLLLLVCDTISPIFYKILVDDVLINKNLNKLIIVCVGYSVVFAINSLLIIINKRISNKLLLPFILKLKSKLLRRLIKIPADRYEQYNPGDLKNRIDNDTTICANFISTQIVVYIFNWIYVVIFGIVICCINVKLSLFAFLMIPISFLFTKVLAKRSGKISDAYREEWGKYEGFIHNTLQNWREIKAFNLEKLQDNKLSEYWDVLSKLFVKRQLYWYINRTFISFKDFFITKMNLYFLGGLLIFSGEMSVGSLLIFMVYYENLFSKIGAINDLDMSIQQDLPSINKVIEILNVKTIFDKKYKLTKVDGKINFEKVSFSYKKDDEEAILKNINITISPKEKIAIVGRSGCGKSTLAKLLVNIYEPDEGRITLNNIEMNQYESTSFHKKFGIMVQEPYMFNLSIKENLLLGNPKASYEELVNACKSSNIEEFIKSLPNGFDTIIGERGIRLSGGQKQRLAIARSLLSNTEVMIFDEATSALDYDSEKNIFKAIEELCSKKTIIIIAHRLSSIILSDRVVVLDKGEVVGIGHYSELLNKNKVFNKLFKEQYNVFENSKHEILEIKEI